MSGSHSLKEERYIPDQSSSRLDVPRSSIQQPSKRQQQEKSQQSDREPNIISPASHKRLKRSSSNSNEFVLPLRPTKTTPPSALSLKLTSEYLANEPNEMSDGSMSRRSSKTPASANRESENEARALRVLEIMNDFRTLQVHITSLVSRSEASPPDQASYYLNGYALLRQCNAEAQAILATNYNPGSLGLGSGGRVPDTEVQKATLQR